MNKLYILGALALSNVQGYINFGTTTFTTLAYTTANSGHVGSYTYTVSGDCLGTTATATTLGMNNIYKQYYSFTVKKGTVAWGTINVITGASPPTTIATVSITAALNACYHQHLYNWMAQPVTAASAAIAGFGNNLVAYGYAMTGTTVTACAATTVAAALYSSTTKLFSGAQYQSVSMIYVPASGTVASNTINIYGRVGPMYGYYVKAQTVSANTIITPTAGVVVTASQNAYWDFQQTNVVQGATQFGRGGGASPCGWYVFYAYESGASGMNSVTDTANLDITNDDITVHMWTDNSVIKAASAFVLTALAGLLF